MVTLPFTTMLMVDPPIDPIRLSGITASGPASPISAVVGLVTMPPDPKIGRPKSLNNFSVVGLSTLGLDGATGPMKPGSPGFFIPGVEGIAGLNGEGSCVPGFGTDGVDGFDVDGADGFDAADGVEPEAAI